MSIHALKAGVAGGTGYLGAELLRLLASHGGLDVVAVQAATSAGSPLAELYPQLAKSYEKTVVTELDASSLDGLDVVFLALPAGSSMALVTELDGRCGLVVDLGPDFRLTEKSDYERWYGFTHEARQQLSKAVYGLVEVTREALVGAELVAAPGCYVTAAGLGLWPFTSQGLVEREGIVIDAASGTSGAGKTLDASLHHPRMNEQFAAYKVAGHRHTPEMEQLLQASLVFTPHLAPMTRGILATCYARPTPAVSSTKEAIEVLAEAYRGESFVHVTTELVSTAHAYGSNVCHLTARFDERTGWLIVLSAIDNLIKGGSGQGLQAANVALGLSEQEGLPLSAMAP